MRIPFRSNLSSDPGFRGRFSFALHRAVVACGSVAYNDSRMPTLFENIAQAFKHLMRLHKGEVLHILRAIVGIVITAVLLECLVFNFNYFRTLGYSSTDLTSQLTLQQNAAKQYKLTEVDHVIEFSNINKHIDNLYLNLDPDQPAQVVEVKVQFTDEAHATYFDSTEYTQGVPVVEVSTTSKGSKYLNLNTTGNVTNLHIEIVSKKTSYPLYLLGVSINTPEPFAFNPLRFVIVLSLLLLGYAFRPKSSIYKLGIRETPRLSRGIMVCAVIIEIFVMSAYLLFGSNLVGIATKDYNSGSWDQKSIVNVFEVGGENAQQYAMLAQSLANGKLYLEEEPPDWLKEMDEPYDRGARDELQKETGEPYLFDVAYYEGHYYVYFGVVPEVVFYLPFYLLTGKNFPTAIGILIMCILFVAGCAALLDRFARYHFKRVSLGLYLLLQIPLVMCCGLLYLLKFPTFYSLPIMCAMAFSIWGLYFWMRGRSSERASGWYLAGSLCMALVFGCRPQLVVFSLLAFPLFWNKFITKGHIRTKQGVRQFACLVAPYVVVVAGVMWYNYARFGSPMDFGANYNLTVNDMTKRGMNVGRIAPALFAYFFQTPSTTGVFPFIQGVHFETTYLGQTIKEVTFGGIFATIPLLWVLLFARPILKLRLRQRSTHTVASVVMVLLASGFIVAILDAEMAGILQRYYADFSFMFLAATVLLVFIVNENLPVGSDLSNRLMFCLTLAVAVSVAYSVLLCFIPETGWVSDIYPWAYHDILEMVRFWA